MRCPVASELEKLGKDRRASSELAIDDGEHLFGAFVAGDRVRSAELLVDVRPSIADGADRISEVVADARRHLPDGVESLVEHADLLRFAELLFGELLVRHVEGDALEEERSASVVANEPRLAVEPNGMAVFGEHAAGRTERPAGLDAAREL